MDIWSVYLYHFRNASYGYERNNTFVAPKHYCGVTNNVAARDATHRTGNGSKFIKSVCVEQKRSGAIVLVIDCTNKKSAYLLERALKKGKHLSRVCPCCSENSRSTLNNYLGRLNIDVPF